MTATEEKNPEALTALRAAFFLFDKETPTRCRE